MPAVHELALQFARYSRIYQASLFRTAKSLGSPDFDRQDMLRASAIAARPAIPASFAHPPRLTVAAAHAHAEIQEIEWRLPPHAASRVVANAVRARRANHDRCLVERISMSIGSRRQRRRHNAPPGRREKVEEKGVMAVPRTDNTP